MALFTQQTRKDDGVPKSEPRFEPWAEPEPLPTTAPPAPARAVERSPAVTAPAKASESIVAAGLTIEGKIEGSGNVRVAGRFKGNVNVKGELTIEPGASISGEVSADTIFVGG